MFKFLSITSLLIVLTQPTFVKASEIDKDMDGLRVVELIDGFMLSVSLDAYQFIRNDSSIRNKCIDRFHEVISEQESINRKLVKPFEVNNMMITNGYNEFSGMANCMITGTLKWQDSDGMSFGLF